MTDKSASPVRRCLSPHCECEHWQDGCGEQTLASPEQATPEVQGCLSDGSKVSPRDLDALIARHVLGLECWDIQGDFRIPIAGTEDVFDYIQTYTCPAYSADLNACADAEAKCIEKVGDYRYLTALAEQCGVSFAAPLDYKNVQVMVTAPPLTRSRSLLKAVGVDLAAQDQPNAEASCNPNEVKNPGEGTVE